jgi:hypothetical protein
VSTALPAELEKTTLALDQRRWALDALSSLGDGVLIVDERARLVYLLSWPPCGWSGPTSSPKIP